MKLGSELSPEEESTVRQLIKSQDEQAARNYLRLSGMSAAGAKRAVERCSAADTGLMHALGNVHMDSVATARGDEATDAQSVPSLESLYPDSDEARQRRLWRRRKKLSARTRVILYGFFLIGDFVDIVDRGWSLKYVLFRLGFFGIVVIPLEIVNRLRSEAEPEESQREAANSS